MCVWGFSEGVVLVIAVTFALMEYSCVLSFKKRVSIVLGRKGGGNLFFENLVFLLHMKLRSCVAIVPDDVQKDRGPILSKCRLRKG